MPVTEENYQCPHCGTVLTYSKYHAGFSDIGYMYCDSDSTVVTWSSFDPHYGMIVPDTHPWMLSAEQMKLVEQAIVDCPNGGKFRFENPPRCWNCRNALPELFADREYFVIISDRLNGETDSIWKN